jgi:hypothetical protein
MISPPIRTAGLRRRERNVAVQAEAFRKKIEAGRDRLDRVGEDSVKAMGSVFLDAIEAIAPRDTNRFVRAYQQAGNLAGLEPRPLLPVTASRNRELFLAALQKQAEHWRKREAYWQGWIDRADADDARGLTTKAGKPRKPRRSQPWYRRYLRNRDRAAARLNKVLNILAEATETESFLLFDKGRFIAGSNRSGRGKRGEKFLSTIRAQVHGGEGWVERAGPVALLHLKNKEAHASIVARAARHGRPVDYALRAIKGIGGGKVSRQAAAALRQATGFAA